MAAEHTIEFRRNFRVDDELARDCHRFQDALLRIDFVFEPHVVIVNRPDASADPCRQAILSAREPLDTMPYPVRRFGSAKRLGWNEEAGTPVLPRNDVQLKLHVQNARGSCWVQQWMVPRPWTMDVAWTPTTRRVGKHCRMMSSARWSLRWPKTGTTTVSLPM